jgi:hypothetical protein
VIIEGKIESALRENHTMLEMSKLTSQAQRLVSETQDILYRFEQNQFDNEALLLGNARRYRRHGRYPA